MERLEILTACPHCKGTGQYIFYRYFDKTKLREYFAYVCSCQRAFTKLHNTTWWNVAMLDMLAYGVERGDDMNNITTQINSSFGLNLRKSREGNQLNISQRVSFGPVLRKYNKLLDHSCSWR